MRDYRPNLRIECILNDALVRLVMASDGVGDDEMRCVLKRAWLAIKGRTGGVSAAAAGPAFSEGRGNAMLRRDLPLRARD